MKIIQMPTPIGQGFTQGMFKLTKALGIRARFINVPCSDPCDFLPIPVPGVPKKDWHISNEAAWIPYASLVVAMEWNLGTDTQRRVIFSTLEDFGNLNLVLVQGIVP